MITLREMLNSLDDSDRRRLNYAFENGLQQFAILKDGKYIGVNTEKVKYLIPETKVGVWAVGTVADKTMVKS